MKYRLTPKGFIIAEYGSDYKKVCDTLELYMRRNGFNGIYLKKSGGFVFVNIKKHKK